MIHQSFAHEPPDRRPSDLAVRVMVGGIWTLVYRCIRDGAPERLIEYLDPLLEWALSYREPDPPAPPQPRPPLPRLEPLSDPLPWSEPADSAESRSLLSQRERITRATAQLASRAGYSSVTIPAISATAGTSNQTFYEYFDSKEGAFIAAFEALATRAITSAFLAIEAVPCWQEAIETGCLALVEHLIEEPIFTRIAFFELPVAGPVALDHADAAVRKFMLFLHTAAIPPGIKPLHPAIVEALGGGIWSALQRKIATGDLSTLPEFSRALAKVTLIPIQPLPDRSNGAQPAIRRASSRPR
jgi:AcrR family transcriptional regulator